MKTLSPEPGDRVLWIRFWAFGDAIEAAADAFNFKRRFPDVHLTFLTNPEYAPLLKVQPYIDGVLEGRKKPFAEWRKTLEQVRLGRFKWLVSGHKGGRTSLLARFGRVPYRVGECSVFPMNLNYNIAPAGWFRSLGLDPRERSAPSLFASPEDREAALAMLKRLPGSSNNHQNNQQNNQQNDWQSVTRRLFVLIGAGSAKKMWPAERWIALLRHLTSGASAGGRWEVILNGHGPLEEKTAREIEDAVASPNLLNLAGALDFRKMAGVASACSMALGNDTGPLHLAALSGVPTMGLFSSSTSSSVGLRMPWFRELCAERFIQRGGIPSGIQSKREIPLKLLPAEPVIEEFEAFAAEFSAGAPGVPERRK